MRWEDGAPGVHPPDQAAASTTSRPMSMVQRGGSDLSAVLGRPSSAYNAGDRTSQYSTQRPALIQQSSSYSYNGSSAGQNFTGVGSSNGKHQYSYSNASAGTAQHKFREDMPTAESTEHLLSLAQPREAPLRPATHVGQRPTSSFYAIDGHSIADYGHGHGDGVSARGSSMYDKAAGSRTSRISFANMDDMVTAGQQHGRSRSSYFNNGEGSVSSPNANRYRTSVASSHYGVAHPSPPISASGSMTALATSADANPADGSPARNNKPRNITVSTSMPFIAQPNGRESIMSPDDLLRAYASAKSPIPMDVNSPDHQEHLSPSASDGPPSRTRSSKKPKFSGVMGFGFNR